MKEITEYKCIIVGDTSVGKSALLTQFVKKSFNEFHVPTIGTVYEEKLITVQRQQIKMKIWDTAGQEAFKSITRSYFNNAAIAFVVYDVTRLDSFRAVRFWLDECYSYGRSDITLVLVGNKIDLPRQVSTIQGTELAEHFNIPFFETSARTGTSVSQVFEEAAKLALQVVPCVPEIRPVSHKLKPKLAKKGKKGKKGKKCC